MRAAGAWADRGTVGNHGCRGLPHAALWPRDGVRAGHRAYGQGHAAGNHEPRPQGERAAGIWNHTFFFFGFPTETLQDAQETVDFLYAHQDVLHSASPGVFVLERYSPVHVDPARFGVRRVADPPDQDLAIYFDYEPESGLDEAMARTVVDRLVDVLPAKRYGQYYLHDVYRFLYASHLHARGRPFPLWLADEAAT